MKTGRLYRGSYQIWIGPEQSTYNYSILFLEDVKEFKLEGRVQVLFVSINAATKEIHRKSIDYRPIYWLTQISDEFRKDYQKTKVNL